MMDDLGSRSRLKDDLMNNQTVRTVNKCERYTIKGLEMSTYFCYEWNIPIRFLIYSLVLFHKIESISYIL